MYKNEDGVDITAEEAGFKHQSLEDVLNTIELNDIVEIITKTGIVLVGLVVCNQNGSIRIVDPCRVESTPIYSNDKNSLHFVTSMLPWRIVGNDNSAQFEKHDISNISKVTSPKFIELWDTTVDELAKIWFKTGNPLKFLEYTKQQEKLTQ